MAMKHKILLVTYLNQDGALENNIGRLFSAVNALSGHLVGGYSIDVAAFTNDAFSDVAKAYLSSVPVDDVYLFRLENLSAENICANLSAITDPYDYVLALSSTFTKDWLPRLAAMMDIQPLTDISDIIGVNQFKRSIYAGNLEQILISNQAKQLLSIRASAFPHFDVQKNASLSADVDLRETVQSPVSSFLVESMPTVSQRPELTSASKVVSGGRGLQNKENFRLIESLADTLGAAVGASRAAVDAGFVTNDLQVGQTGKQIAPDLYLAVAISGAVQHLAGMKDSRIIAVINVDPEAPIFNVADVGLVADLFDVLPQLTEQLKS